VREVRRGIPTAGGGERVPVSEMRRGPSAGASRASGSGGRDGSVLVQPETDSPVLELASEGGLFNGSVTEEEALEA